MNHQFLRLYTISFGRRQIYQKCLVGLKERLENFAYNLCLISHTLQDMTGKLKDHNIEGNQ